MVQVIKVIISVSLISIVSHLSGKKTQMAGFLTALPITSMLAIALSFYEWKDAELTSEYAKSILYAIPLSLLFFVPFLLQKQLHWNFWILYGSGILLLGIGFYIHSIILKWSIIIFSQTHNTQNPVLIPMVWHEYLRNI